MSDAKTDIKFKHAELELKFDASKIDKSSFLDWCFDNGPTRYIYVKGPDFYYRQGDNIIRYRYSGDLSELTTKKRKSKSNTTNRLEIDLQFKDTVTPQDIFQFLAATGWKKEFTLIKGAHIFWFENEVCEVSVVFYEVGRVVGDLNLNNMDETKTIQKRLFVEVEVEKGSKLNPSEAKAQLAAWKSMISKRFFIDRPLNDSLYEIYSGKKYKMVNKQNRRTSR